MIALRRLRCISTTWLHGRHGPVVLFSSSPSGFSHLNPQGTQPQMVDVGHKAVTRRNAIARSIVRLPPAVLEELRTMRPVGPVGERGTGRGEEEEEEGETPGEQRRMGDGLDLVGPKGPIGTTAIIAGVLGAKQTSALLPFCHPLPLEDVQLRVTTPTRDTIAIECEVRVTHKTGVEMEALTGATVAALCVYDMCKALSHDIVIESTQLVAKTGGKRDIARDVPLPDASAVNRRRP